ncbi:MAG: hypothetical protein KIT19_03340 [Phycisphaeraceae bacterium]|nr:hypothetical protein [Phycisphaeraceae bacterium]
MQNHTANHHVPPEQTSASLGEVLDAFHAVRTSIAELMDAVGVDPNKTRESARMLGLNRGLAWRLSRVVREGDVPSVVGDVPGKQSIRKFIAACRERGAAPGALNEAERAIDAFEEAVREAWGDRKTLSTLMASRAETDPSLEQERSRRKLYEGAFAYWGVQAQVRFVTVFVLPSKEDPSMLDAAHITGYLGFRRLSERAWPLAYEVVENAEGEARKFHKSPLDPTGGSEAHRQLMKQFCRPETPEIRVVECGGEKRFELAPGPVGNAGLTTCVFGSYLHQIAERYPSAPDTCGFMVRLQTPVERLIFDMFVHKDIGLASPPAAQLLDRMTYQHTHIEADFPRQALPLSERVVPLHGGRHAVTSHIPWYPRMLDWVSERIGLGLDAFDASRFEMTYPPISTTLSRRFPTLPRA